MSLTDPGSFYEVRQKLTSILKVYPDFVKLEVLNEPFDYHRYDYDPKRYRPSDSKKHKEPEDPAEIEKRNEWRARTNFIDLTLANNFDLFPTFTFDQLKVEDRYDVDSLKRHMSHWLNNQRHIHGKFKYIILPQYHKCEACVKAKAKVCFHTDAPRAIHFHAMFGGYGGNIADTGHKYPKGQIKYDVKSYQLGMAKAFTIGNTIDDRQRIGFYIARYIARDMPKFHRRHRYWASLGLKRPLKILNPLLTEEDRSRFQEIPTKSKRIQIYELRGQFTDAELARIANYGRPREDDLTVLER